MYNSYLKEDISKEIYLQEKEKLNKKEDELKNVSSDEIVEYNTFKKEINLKEIVESFIQEVKIFDDKNIQIYFKNSLY